MHDQAGRVLAIGLAAFLSASVGAEEAARDKEQPKMEFPQIVISNDALKLTIYLPDAEKGRYRGARFDWSGMIARAEFGGRTVFGPFRAKNDPAGHDTNVSGPAEEFDMDSPPGYADAKPGEPFMKIGVGLLERGKEAKYGFPLPYKIAKAGEWKVTSGKDWVEFRQDLACGPWAYAYTKRIGLAAGGAGFTLAHTLRNTGTKPLDTTTYCHNFTLIDDDPVGPDYRVTFPFDLVAKAARGTFESKGREIAFPEEVKGSVWVAFETGTGKAEYNQVTVENRRTGTGVKIVGDRPVAEWRFYAEKTAACPEPFLRIQAAPGAEEKWQTQYTLLAGPRAEK